MEKGLKKVKIAISILNSDFLHLGSEIEKIESLGIDCLHLDIMDGNFVPQLTFGHPLIKQIRKKTGLFLDTHLMVENTDTVLKSYIDCGPDMITVHAESSKHLHRCLKQVKEYRQKACVALNPSTPVCMLEHVLDLIDGVLIMSVNPGYGGQSFISSSISKVRQCRQMLDAYCRAYRPDTCVDILVDGGMNETTSKDVIQAGATVIVMGSVFFKSKDPARLIESIRSGSSRLSLL